MKKSQQTTGLTYLDLPVPIRAVCNGLPVRIINVGIAGCGFEWGDGFVALRPAADMTDFEPLILWLDATGRRAQWNQHLVVLPHPVVCERREDGLDLVSLTAVGPDGRWSGHDEAGEPVHVRLSQVQVAARTEDYLAEIREITFARGGQRARRITPCTRG